MNYDTLTNVPISYKTVFLRCDLNVPIVDGKIFDDTRLQRSLKTIKYLVRNKAKVIICTHLGRPKGRDEKYSTKIIADYLINFVNTRIQHVDFNNVSEIWEYLDNIEYGDVLVLENIRYYKEEKENDAVFAEELADLCDIYINDALSCSHRKHASIVGITEFVKSVAGFNLDEEYSVLNSYFEKNYFNSIAIIGGSKVSTKIDVIKNLLNKFDKIFFAGGILNTYLKYNGFNIADSLYEEGMENIITEITSLAKHQNVKIILPSHVKVLNQDAVYIREIDKILPNDKILDISLNGLNELFMALESSKFVIWNGPLGMYEDPRFADGSITLAKHIAELTREKRIVSIAGGGDVVSCINKSGSETDFTFISTSGGAFLDMLGGKKMYGIEALRENCRHDMDVNKPI